MEIVKRVGVPVVTSATLPANSFLEMIDYAKRNPGKISYATTGIGTTGHLVGALIERIAGINMVHVPYKGGTQSLPDLISGQLIRGAGIEPE